MGGLMVGGRAWPGSGKVQPGWGCNGVEGATTAKGGAVRRRQGVRVVVPTLIRIASPSLIRIASPSLIRIASPSFASSCPLSSPAPVHPHLLVLIVLVLVGCCCLCSLSPSRSLVVTILLIVVVVVVPTCCHHPCSLACVYDPLAGLLVCVCLPRLFCLWYKHW